MKQKINKVFDVITYCFIFVAVIFTIFTISSKKNSKDGITFFGHQMLVVETESMEKNELVNVEDYEIKSINKNSMVFVKVVDEENPYEFYKDIEINDVLTFKYMVGNTQQTITHRIIDIKEEGEGFVYYLRGDNINADGTTSTQVINTNDTNSFNYVIGKVVYVSYPIGLLVSILRSDVGLIGVIIIPCVILIIFEITKIINELNKDKKQKEKDREIELKNKNQELEELKRKLQELEKDKKEGE